MIDDEMFERLESYLAENYVELQIKFSVGPKYSGLSGFIQERIDNLLAKFDHTFSNYLRDLIKSKGLTEIEVYKKACLDRRIFSKLRNDRSYKPSKRTILSVAFAMELNLNEAEDLLKQGGYALSEYSKFDVIIRFFFENQIYDLFLINEILDCYDFKPLSV